MPLDAATLPRPLRGTKALRVVLFADTHLGFDLPQHARTPRRRRGDDFAANYHRVLGHAVQTKPHLLVHGGDFFSHSRVAPGVVDEAFAALYEVATLGIPVVIAPGNHDRSRLPSSIWLGHPNIHVLHQSRTVLLQVGGMRVAVGGFPFLRGDLREKLPRALQDSTLATTRADLRFLCMHQTVAGARVGPNGFTFTSGPQAIPHTLIPGSITAILAGHIHRSQVLERLGCPPVFYPGSTERTSFAERNETKGFFDLTFATDASGGAPVEVNFIELPARPMVDLALPNDLRESEVPAYLAAAARGLPGDAIVRISASDPAPSCLARQLTAALLRSSFPETMNIQLSRGIVDAFR
jgi:DNA repair exonuclease SbcCD nuclease subunit